MSTTEIKIDGLTAAEHAAKAAQCAQSAYDSFERCDTDGFLSQWASNLTSNLHRAKAEIAARGGKHHFTGLYEGDRRVAARMIDTQFGDAWLLREDEAAKFGRKFIPTGSTSRIQKKLGLAQRKEWDRADAKIDGHGRGLSGTAWVATYRVDERATWGLTSTPLTAEELVKYEEGTL